MKGQAKMKNLTILSELCMRRLAKDGKLKLRDSDARMALQRIHDIKGRLPETAHGAFSPPAPQGQAVGERSPQGQAVSTVVGQ